ncbi:MAG: hypothetical protein EXS35_08640 [Pedosphaera sp.]|nr:hypothetical protein [Pedosphaera sp.]
MVEEVDDVAIGDGEGEFLVQLAVLRHERTAHRKAGRVRHVQISLHHVADENQRPVVGRGVEEDRAFAGDELVVLVGPGFVFHAVVGSARSATGQSRSQRPRARRNRGPPPWQFGAV